MALTPENVRVAGAGEVYVADEGTTLPVDIETALPVDWTGLGYVTTDGVGFSFNRETNPLNAWQGDNLRVLTTAEPKSVNFALLETSADTFPVVFGGGSIDVEAGPPSYATFTPPDKGVNTVRAMVIVFTDEDITYRYCLPRVQIEGEVSFNLTREDGLSYPMTFTVLDATPPYLIITDDPALTGA